MNVHLKSLIYMAIAGVLFWLFLPERFAINMPVQMANSITEQEALDRLEIAEGFKLSVFANKLSGARAIITTEIDDLIISRPNLGIITLVLKDTDNDGRSDGNSLLLEGLNKPHGLALHQGWLYVAETDAVLRIRYDSQQRKFIGTPHYIIRNQFPGGGNHWARSVRIGPDNKLYISVGSSCNACIEETPQQATILQYELDGTKGHIFASGLRNTTGFDWQPTTQILYGLDIGRDFLGDDLPAEEVNQISKGQHYGWPFEYGSNTQDSNVNNARPKNVNMLAPVYKLPAHSTPLSLLFTSNNSQLNGSALITLHGSWNRSKKSGYSIIKLSFDANNKISHQPFITGFEENETVIGRPVDLAEDKQGNIYISDDYTGRIYKVIPIKQTTG